MGAAAEVGGRRVHLTLLCNAAVINQEVVTRGLLLKWVELMVSKFMPRPQSSERVTREKREGSERVSSVRLH